MHAYTGAAKGEGDCMESDESAVQKRKGVRDTEPIGFVSEISSRAVVI